MIDGCINMILGIDNGECAIAEQDYELRLQSPKLQTLMEIRGEVIEFTEKAAHIKMLIDRDFHEKQLEVKVWMPLSYIARRDTWKGTIELNPILLLQNLQRSIYDEEKRAKEIIGYDPRY
jgi:hypothetical protein